MPRTSRRALAFFGRIMGAPGQLLYSRQAHAYAAARFVGRHGFDRLDPSRALPRRWLDEAYCTTCLDGPIDPRNVVMVWGGPPGKPFVVSGARAD